MGLRELEDRTISEEFPELLEHLRSGMSVLDVGCGRGTITLDVAKVIEPGNIIGIDIDNDSINSAIELAKERGISNASFEVMDAHKLQFTDNMFDLVYSYTVAHFWFDPTKVLRELKRVSKPGAWIITAGVRDAGIDLRHPASGPMRGKLWAAVIKCMEARRTSYQSGDTDAKFYIDFQAGRKCVQWYADAGIKDLQFSGRIEDFYYPGASTKDSVFFEFLSLRHDFLNIYFDEAIADGYLDREILDKAREEAEKWIQGPHVFCFNTIIHAKGRA